ncbi:TlpA family protein disulfide reductase [Anatilimnocola floriformis]|uniref:TlpA family protein disulfide reductase n=1 Tax=Anatilimnocola floriformis TaxID=2948575 RepID=UPI0020C4158D|nr:TlpA disulfide reductase family protein [Anatilimnocola floriformis]
MFRSLVAAVSLLLFSAWQLPAAEVLVGDAAPPLAVKEFVKGEPVKEFAKGKVYVVEFWATWCGPCIKAIPHVSELQAKHKAVTFIGVDVMERADDEVKAFVKKMGDKMNYRVAIDKPDGDGDNGVMAQTWLDASYQMGIPCSMIVDGAGKLAWVGHPMKLEEPLEKVIAGKWDLAAAAKEFKAEIEAAKIEANLTEAVDKLIDAEKYTEAIKLLDEGFAKAPALEQKYGMVKFSALIAQEKEADAYAYGNKLLEKFGKEDPNIPFGLAMSVLTDDDDKPVTELEAPAAKFAVTATSQLVKTMTTFKGVDDANRSVANETHAFALFLSGNAKEAAATQEKAIALAKGTPREKDKTMVEKLKKYQAGLKK